MTKLKIFLFCLLLSSFFVLPQLATANDLILQIPIGERQSIAVSGSSFSEYVKAVLIFASSAIVVLSIVMIIVGGIQWVILSPTPERISQAKDTIFKSFVGMFIAIFAVFILQTVSPGTVELKPLEIQSANGLVCCKTGTTLKWTAIGECAGEQVSVNKCIGKGGDKGIDEECASSARCLQGLYCSAIWKTCQPKKGQNQDCVGEEINGRDNLVCISGDCGIIINPGKCSGGQGTAKPGEPCSNSGMCDGGFCTSAGVCERYRDYGADCDGVAIDEDNRVCGPNDSLAICNDGFLSLGGSDTCIFPPGTAGVNNYCTHMDQCQSDLFCQGAGVNKCQEKSGPGQACTDGQVLGGNGDDMCTTGNCNGTTCE